MIIYINTYTIVIIIILIYLECKCLKKLKYELEFYTLTQGSLDRTKRLVPLTPRGLSHTDEIINIYNISSILEVLILILARYIMQFIFVVQGQSESVSNVASRDFENLHFDFVEADFNTQYITCTFKGDTRKVAFKELRSMGLKTLMRYLVLMKQREELIKLMYSGLVDEDSKFHDLYLDVKFELSSKEFNNRLEDEFQVFTREVMRTMFRVRV